MSSSVIDRERFYCLARSPATGFGAWAAATLMVLAACPRAPAAQGGPPSAPGLSSASGAPQGGQSEPSDAEKESQALDQAFQSAGGNPQRVVRNLGEFLARFPRTSRRTQVLRTMIQQAFLANDPRAAAVYAEQYLDENPDDLNVLAMLVDFAERNADPAGRKRAVEYATRLLGRLEKPGESPDSTSARGQPRPDQNLVAAAAYSLRGRLYQQLGENEKACADLEKSLAAHPGLPVAERLGDLQAARGATDRAVFYYATAFALAADSPDAQRRARIRAKLGRAYVGEKHSEAGLGDLILARYDDLAQSLRPVSSDAPPASGNVSDPFQLTLPRPDGSELRLADLRGKVMVLDFWATWCGPCRLEGRLLEQVIQHFRSDARAAFLAVNVDEERSGVPTFLKAEKWTVPVAYAQGLDRLLGVGSLPTLLIVDRDGKVVFREVGVDASQFIPTLEAKLAEALTGQTPSVTHSR